jgi:hypothetical protein
MINEYKKVKGGNYASKETTKMANRYYTANDLWVNTVCWCSPGKAPGIAMVNASIIAPFYCCTIDLYIMCARPSLYQIRETR